jgi:hypothetical protein
MQSKNISSIVASVHNSVSIVVVDSMSIMTALPPVKQSPSANGVIVGHPRNNLRA